MEFEIISKKPIDSRNLIVTVKLKPNSDEERVWIKDVEEMKENEAMTNYLLFCLGDRFSVLSADPMGNNQFQMKVFDNL